MFKSIAEIVLRSIIAKENLNPNKQFLSWDHVKTIAIVLSNNDKINKSAIDKFIDGTGKLVSVFYLETAAKTPTFADWQCFCKNDSSFLGLPRKIIQQDLRTRKFDLAINTCDESDIFASALITTLMATLKCGSGKKYNDTDLIIQKSDPYHVIDYLNEVIKYLKMIRT